MDEKIKETKIAILERIQKAVKDDTKSLSAETLTAMANIVSNFDGQEIYKKEPKYNTAELIKNALDKATTIETNSHMIADKGEI